MSVFVVIVPEIYIKNGDLFLSSFIYEQVMSNKDKAWDNLLEFLPKIELSALEEEIPEGDNPIWYYWEPFTHFLQRYGKSNATAQSVRSGLRVVVRHMGIYTVENLNSRAFRTALEQYQDVSQISASTFNTYRKNANTFILWLKQEGYVTNNYIRNIPKVTERIKEQETFTSEQLDQIINNIINRNSSPFCRKRDLLIFQILRLTGARRIELLDMNTDAIYKDSQSKQWIIKIDGKKQKGRIRYYKCSNGLKDIYRDYMNWHQGMSKKLFINDKGQPMTMSTMGNLYKRMSREVGFKISGHKIRRYVATELDQQGLATSDIMRYLGHSRATTTERYIARSGSLTFKGMKIMTRLASKAT